jgi:hypothetical protein
MLPPRSHRQGDQGSRYESAWDNLHDRFEMKRGKRVDFIGYWQQHIPA